jgi:hypothetical protein
MRRIAVLFVFPTFLKAPPPFAELMRILKRGMPHRYRLYFRFASSPVKVIVYVWFNDENALHNLDRPFRGIEQRFQIGTNL